MSLLGAWELERFVVRCSGRDDRYPFGEDAQGLIVYSPGWMSAVLSRRGRTLPGTTRLEDSHRASGEAKAAAFDSYLSYAGTWHLDGDTVVHRVEVALTPGAVGREQRRQFVLQGDQLALSYTVQRGADAFLFRLDWTRLE